MRSEVGHTHTHTYTHSHSFHIQICVISRQMAWHQSSASTRICMCASHDTKSKALNKHSDCYAINSVCDFVILLSCLEFDLFLYLFFFYYISNSQLYSTLPFFERNSSSKNEKSVIVLSIMAFQAVRLSFVRTLKERFSRMLLFSVQ